MERPGSRRALSLSWRAAIDACVHCGLCLPHCPTYDVLKEETDSPRGRIVLLAALLEGQAEPEEVRAPIDRCIGCLACESACPSGVRYRDLLEEGRRRLAPQRSWVRFVLERVLPRRRLVRGLARAGRLFGRLPRAGATAPWPDPPENPRARVALHLGCLTDALFPRLAREAALVLTRLNFHVDPVEGCCGALHRHAGLDDSRQRVGVERLCEAYDLVVSAAAGCSATDGVTDLTALLMEHAPFDGDAPAIRVAYDAPCHLLHAQGVDASALLDSIPGVERVPFPGSDQCCGAGGLYMEMQADLASQVRARKLDAIEASGADCVATGNPGCLFWLWKGLKARGSKVEVAHPVTLLARAFS